MFAKLAIGIAIAAAVIVAMAVYISHIIGGIGQMFDDGIYNY